MIDNKILTEILNNQGTHFENLCKKHQINLLTLIQQFLNGNRKHNNPGNQKYLSPQYLGSCELKNMFPGSGSYYKSVISPYFKCLDENYKKGKDGFTKKWKLQEWILTEVEKYLLETNYIPITTITKDKKKIVEIVNIPDNGVSFYNNSINSNFYIPSIIDINTEQLDRYIELFPNFQLKLKSDKKNIYNQLLSIKRHLKNNLYPNKFLQLYQQSSNGRFYKKEGIGVLHPTQLSQDIRNIIFSEMDLYSIDISNCHLSILYNLGLKYGYICYGIKRYLDDKIKIRNSWRKAYGNREGYIKEYIISWIYGNTNNVGNFNSFDKKLGQEIMMKIKFEDTILIELYKDIQIIKKLVIDNIKISKGNYLNIWNYELPVKVDGKKTPKKNILPHILFGYESKIMEVVNTEFDSGIKALIHDGYIGNYVNPNKLNQIVKKKLNMEIQFDVKNILPPMEKKPLLQKIHYKGGVVGLVGPVPAVQYNQYDEYTTMILINRSYLKEEIYSKNCTTMILINRK